MNLGAECRIQGDKAVIHVLQTMGAIIQYDMDNHELHIKRSKQLVGREINVNDFVDAVPILAVIGCYAEGVTKITGAAIARKKESDRLVAITTELRKMGANITDTPDGLIIKQSILQGAQVDSHNDHRIAMALSVAGFVAKGKTDIRRIECIAKTYPKFLATFSNLGAEIRVEK